MKTLPTIFTISFLGAPVEVTQVDRIDPRLLDEEITEDGEESSISGLFLAHSNEILISRKQSEVMKYVTFARCLAELAEHALEESHPVVSPRLHAVQDERSHQVAVTLLAGLVAAGAVEISADEFQQFMCEQFGD